ncbi:MULTISPECIES: arginase family protein [Microbacterium]|uniref:arginase family protein n=1 Tax=Microbacterium TaxID=33882 RepID=UPI00217E71DE|nr:MULTISPECIES: arginase family protein [Microbacterium]UWF78258.1 arginase family protein [Microbacterium neungamense]WCM56430.1 arginase family protein [Microbacterium sp. EF45047]
MTRFLIVPQWQGSPAARAMLLTDGATAIAGDLPRKDTVTLDIPLEAGESLGTGVRRLSSLLRIRELVREAYTGGTVVVGGDCSVTPAALSAVDTTDLAVVWCDAHPDLHVPDTSRSGAFSGMALSAVLGDGEPRLALSPGIPRERVVTVGARAIDVGEAERLDGISALGRGDLSDPDALAEAVHATGASHVWVHIDVDVLDPADLGGVSAPAPFGVDAAELAASIRRLRERLPLTGATIAGFAPRTPADAVQDLGAVLRLIGAVA